jgi:hypothetical protein
LEEVFEYFSNKKDGHGIDGIRLLDSMISHKKMKEVGRGMREKPRIEKCRKYVDFRRIIEKSRSTFGREMLNLRCLGDRIRTEMQ